MSISDITHVPVTRYVPQSPTPHSPPETPSPSSPIRHDSDLGPSRDTIDMSRTPTTPTPTKTRRPQSQPPFSRFTPESDSSPIEPLTPTEQDGEAHGSRGRGSCSSRQGVQSSTMSGMGIDFPAEFNPLPAELHSPRRDAVKKTHALSPESSTMLRTRSDPTSAPSSPTSTPSRPSPFNQDQLPQSIARPRTTSPFPANIQMLASSSSVNRPGTDSGNSTERVPSPTDHKFPDIFIESHDSRSPAMDGKKEPSIKALSFVSSQPDPYEPTRRNGFLSKNSYTSYGYEKFPLSEPYRPVSPVPTPTISKNPFTESTAYLLGLYFCLNLGLTLFNKVVLVSFPFPYVGRIV